jgi:hypothetical protein
MITNRTEWGQYEAQRKIVIDEKGTFWKVIEERTPFDPGTMLDTMVKEAGFFAPMLAADTWLFLKKDSVAMFKRLREIPFRIGMVMEIADGKPVATPAFDSPVGGLVSDPPFMYNPPANQILYFILVYQTIVDLPTPYLVAKHTEAPGLYHPILPNVYNTGKICTGAVDPAAGRVGNRIGLEGAMNSMLQAWSASTWNSDLAGANNGNPQAWLKFDEKTRKHVPPAGKDWRDYAGPSIAPSPMIVEAFSKGVL